MLPYRDSRLTKIALGIFFVIVLGYAYFEARGILYGPSINVSTEITQSDTAFVSIKGQAERITALSMNGKAIPVTEEGVFDEPYLLAPGLNRITLDATDRYGRSRKKVIQIVYTQGESSSSATTTPPQGSEPTATSSSSSEPMAQ
jgi:hypothetical protein